eukprot:TRINITY_DN1877_c1_g1_i7.p1 TRINITY_DN1877_c1_g1~~TRINITY_DN1877_c1_g1_i7.p1  ORF type:complete len:121 (+),score=11.82 TRINITY_DN1877_c1_g1_i7:26-388(+)
MGMNGNEWELQSWEKVWKNVGETRVGRREGWAQTMGSETVASMLLHTIAYHIVSFLFRPVVGAKKLVASKPPWQGPKLQCQQEGQTLQEIAIKLEMSVKAVHTACMQPLGQFGGPAVTKY